MAKIIQLSETVANQISAGEVIERPASVVKELVENSIDAASDKILVDIENGGKEKIRIKDNGCGIAEEELELAFSRYATSKIKNINDLYSLNTLGFRGEALASIASVSKLKISSKPKEQLKGVCLEIKGGKILAKKTVGLASGTDIIVNDIFYNTPARYKYLKTTNTEFGHISNIVSKEALAYPNIQFSLLHNQRQVLKTPGNGKLKDTIYAIYGKELVDNLIPIDFEDRYISLTGYIATPNFYRASRVYELFFVNHRTVYNRVLSRGVEAGYQGLLPPRSYPVVFLALKLNQILVDVNVHPSKKEIKFSRDEIIEDVIKQGIKETLKTINPSPKLNIKKTQEKKEETKKTKIQSTLPLNNENTEFNNQRQKDNNSKNININNNNNSKNENLVNKHESIVKNNINKDNINIKENEINKENENINKTKEIFREEIKKIIGQIHNSYILVEAKDGLYIIDQHNAHEQILYEQYQKKYQSNKIVSQSLLIPITIDTTLAEIEIINKYKEDLNKLGLKIEAFGGNSFVVQEVPAILAKRSTKQFIKELIDKLLTEGKTMKQEEIIDDIITFMSCRGAIKAGHFLAREEIESIVQRLWLLDNKYRCPHGRPIIIHLSNKDLERELGRS